MELSFNLKTVATVEIDGEAISTAGGKELYIDGIEVPSVLAQMKDQYDDDGETKDIAAALDLALRLRLGAFNNVTASGFLDDMVKIADMLLISNDVTLPKVRADLEKIKSVGELQQPQAG